VRFARLHGDRLQRSVRALILAGTWPRREEFGTEFSTAKNGRRRKSLCTKVSPSGFEPLTFGFGDVTTSPFALRMLTKTPGSPGFLRSLAFYFALTNRVFCE
jgi:hypothetical protein